MSNPWFRMYAEFVHDPKVQMLSESMQRRYVMLMCLRCSNALVTLHETEVAFALRISDEDLAATKALFVAKGFIDSSWNLLNWEKRQFASDSSAARVAKHRALKKQADEESGNVAVTLPKRKDNAPDSDTDTDKKTSTPPSAEPPGFTSFWSIWPKSERKEGKGKCLQVWLKAKLEPLSAVILAHVESKKLSAGWTKQNGEFIPAPLVYLNGRKWEGAELVESHGADAWAGAVN